MSSDLLFLLAVTPVCLFAAYWDLSTMTIPNEVSLVLVAIFIAIGVFALPLPTLGFALLAGFIALVVGFAVNQMGYMGGGDVKFLAAFTPFVSAEGAPLYLYILSGSMLLTLGLHRLAKAIPAVRRATPGWKSWDAGRNFPMGISIALAAISYLSIRAFA